MRVSYPVLFFELNKAINPNSTKNETGKAYFEVHNSIEFKSANII